jgi:hypothetical protein
MIDGDFSAGFSCSVAGGTGIEVPSFCVGVVGVEAAAKTTGLSVLGFLAEGSSRDGSDTSAMHVRTKGRKTRLTPTINSTYHSASSALNLFRAPTSALAKENHTASNVRAVKRIKLRNWRSKRVFYKSPDSCGCRFRI